MLAIPLPPYPALTTSLHCWLMVAAMLAGGIALLLWGRVIGRFVLAAAGIPMGIKLGVSLGAWAGGGTLAFQIGLAIAFPPLIFFFARAAWAHVSTAFAGGMAVMFIVNHYLPKLGDKKIIAFAPFNDLGSYAASMYHYCLSALELVWDHHSTAIIFILAPACLIPLIVSLIRPAVAAIFLTAVAGAMLVVGVLWSLAVQWRPVLWPDTWGRFLIPLAVMLVIAAIGWVYQGHGEITAARKSRKDAKPAGKAGSDKKAAKDAGK